ncbi:MAG: hypothetical protein KJ556_05710 [Gammaproteobacteria bacterium]|nr:hypothetical protein [Gammaproteobacteria bacterium]MBU2056864.1 hypothetical protein [Gammaproteobacteria bacterium]MBU2174604.1 hypothetical protein [Gammaproteobacteria bacterium]MBU2248297.1 hypothetical protein [Gammaproteobacteria bacterium]MBU2343699.1 hypothetical protein [Gammaproteobacteria bacterium]
MMRAVLIGCFMPKPMLRLLVLLLIMLNHAVSACESIVMHLPEENHPFSLFDNSSHSEHQHCAVHESAEDAAGQEAEHNDNHHPTHAHVACYIAELYSVSADPVVHKASGLAQYAMITTSYTPLVPPPNA